MRFRLSFMLLAAALSSAFGASQIQEEWGTYGGNGFFSWEAKETTAYGNDRYYNNGERARFLRKPDERIQIERKDLDKRWVIDPRHKRYTEESISAAREKAIQDVERHRKEWEKKEPKAEKRDDATGTRIRSVRTDVKGPGAAETVNGLSCRPYTVTTVVEYENLPDHKRIGTQTLYQKEWTSEAPVLLQYRKDEMAYWQTASAGEVTRPETKELVDALRKQLAQKQSNAAQDPWVAHISAVVKIKGTSVRTVGAMTFEPVAEPVYKSAQSEDKDDALVQPGDLSGGVGGLVGGIASRWASKKVEKKVQQKMEEHPAWVDEASKDLGGQPVAWGWLSEIKSAGPVESPALFDLPAGYKKVASL